MKQEEEVVAEGYGFKASFKGTSTFWIIYLTSMFFILAWLIWDHDNNTKARTAMNASTLTRAHGETMDELAKSNQKMDEVIYVLSLTQEERQQLKIAMPPSLREKVREKYK